MHDREREAGAGLDNDANKIVIMNQRPTHVSDAKQCNCLAKRRIKKKFTSNAESLCRDGLLSFLEEVSKDG